jgi:hypothetical protein
MTKGKKQTTAVTQSIEGSQPKIQISVLQPMLQQIVSKYFPTESEAFSVGGHDYLEMAASGQSLDSLSKRAAVNNEFGESVVPLLKMVILVWNTVKVFLEIDKLLSGNDHSTHDALAKRWEADLISGGMDAGIARAIATRHAGELLQLRQTK